MKNEADLDFSTVEITEYTAFSFSYYDNTVKGSSYSLDINVRTADKETEMKIELVRNKNGYGIYNLNINP